MRLIITGGGTGGHIYPALAIADYFKNTDKNAHILYIGGKHGIENEILKNYDYDYLSIDVLGIRRKISLDNVSRVFKSIKAMIKMKKIIRDFKPDLVIGTGGYVTGPVVYMAEKMNIKTAILEQNVFMGMANKILAKNVDHIFYGFEEALKRYPYKNVTVSGNPVRTQEFKNTKAQSRSNLGYGDEKIILSIGGSGGSDSLNECIPELVKYCMKNEIRLIHVCGRGNKKAVADKTNVLYDRFELHEYISSIGDYMRACDLIICSAGASTLSEVTYLGKPMIVIPKAYTAENHQEYNARMIQEDGAGYCILEKMLTPGILIQKIDSIIFDETLSKRMSENSLKLHKGDSCKIIYDTLVNDTNMCLNLNKSL